MTDPVRRDLVALAAGALTFAAVRDASAQTSTAVQSKPEDRGTFLVESFGAVGDGRTDDRAAIQAAIDMAERNGGGVVVLGNGPYAIGGTIRMDPTLTSLSGSRTVLMFLPAAFPKGSEAGLLVSAKASSASYGQGTQVIEGVEFVGPGSNKPSTGILLKTDVENRSSRIAFRNCIVREFATGVEHSDRCYLTQYYSVQVYNTQKGLTFTSNVDAGENTALFGCSIFNSDIAISNENNTNMFCYGSSFDYCRQWFRGGGLVNFFGCWFEKSRAEKPEDYPFEIAGGRIFISGGGLMTSGIDMDKGPGMNFMFMTRERTDEVVVQHAQGWNWATQSDALMGGPGSISVHGLGSLGALFMPSSLSEGDRTNAFGSGAGFEGKGIGVNCWIASPGTQRADRYAVKWTNENGVYADASMQVSAELARTGKQSLQITKRAGAGTQLDVNFLIPIRPRDAVSFRLWWRSKAPKGVDAPFWFQVRFSQVIGEDRDNIYLFGDDVAWAESGGNIQAGSGQWNRVSFGSYELQQDSPVLSRAPDWATHARLFINMIAVPKDVSLFIDDLGAWRM
jgi:hypothetical protein